MRRLGQVFTANMQPFSVMIIKKFGSIVITKDLDNDRPGVEGGTPRVRILEINNFEIEEGTIHDLCLFALELYNLNK